jgi:hypothetical protein
MQIDELRGELAGLADEIAPFERDVRSLHRRQRRRRITMAAIAAGCAGVLAALAVVAIEQSQAGKARVAARPGREVEPVRISHIDAIVVPATPDVKAALDASPVVGKYAFIPHGDRSIERGDSSSDSLLFTPDRGLCALQTGDGYAVDATTPGTNIRADLQRALAGRATVYDTSDRFGFDFELFLKVNATAIQSSAVEATLNRDPDIYSARHLSKTDAYAVFKREFADQPALVQSTKPSDLPESFRVIVRPDRADSLQYVVLRYALLSGVDTSISPPLPGMFDPTPIARPAQGKLISPCTKP